MAFVLPQFLPKTRAAWLKAAMTTAANWQTSDRTRQQPPRLRSSAVVAICILVGVIALTFVAQSCRTELINMMSAQMQASDILMTRLLNEIEGELDRVERAQLDKSCDASAREELTRQALASTLVREFTFRSDQEPRTCSSFGLRDAEWGAISDPLEGTYFAATQSLVSSIAVIRRRSHGDYVAIVSPRQMFERLPGRLNGQLVKLQSTDGSTLASTGRFDSTGEADAPLESMRHRIRGWPLQLELGYSKTTFFESLRSQWVLFLFIWALTSIIIVMIVNRHLRRRGSRALRLQNALKKRRFAPVMQPILDAQNGHCLGVEVLMRWKHPQRGLIAPAEFIDYAERSGLIVPMSDLIMRQACHQLTDLAMRYPHLYFSFNVTPLQLLTPGFSDSLLRIFNGSPIEPQRVVLELTERDLVDEQIRSELTRMRGLGFRIAIDDFGTGHSSLSLLQDLAVDRLKIDRAFVNSIRGEATSQPVLDAIIALSHRLGLAMIAEGIESPLQADYLRSKGVQAFQGFLYARPMTPQDLEVWLDARDTKVVASAVPPVKTAQAGLTFESLMKALELERPTLEKNRWFRLRRYRSCMLGRELVTFIAKHLGCTREQALLFGQRLVARGLLEHVVEEHDLEDAPFFYRLIPSKAIEDALRNTSFFRTRIGQLSGWLRGPMGVVPGTRCHGFLRYDDAVSGRELVDSLSRAGSITREAAREAGTQMMRAGLIRHVFDETGFVDRPGQYYKLLLDR